MGRHHDRKYGVAAAPAFGRYGMRTGGLGSLVPLIGLGAVVAIIFSMFSKKRTWFRLKGLGWRSWGLKSKIGAGAIASGACATTCATNCATGTCNTVNFNEKLVAAERLPGVKYREVDVITRKRIPLHEVREIYEGPAEMEVFEGTQREYVAPDVGCATGVAASGYSSGYASGQVCTTNCAPVGGIAAGGYASGYGGRLRNRLFRGSRVSSGTTITN